jgi:CBS-domain-containing membrane protein
MTVKSTVKDITTTRVVAVRRDTPFKRMAAELHQQRVSAFPVLDDDGKVAGVVAETDLLPEVTLDAGWADGLPEMEIRKEIAENQILGPDSDGAPG